MFSRRKFTGDSREYEIHPISNDNKHTISKCLNTIPNSNGKLCYCTYFIRTDTLQKNIKLNKLHECRPGDEVGQQIDNFFAQINLPKDPSSIGGGL